MKALSLRPLARRRRGATTTAGRSPRHPLRLRCSASCSPCHMGGLPVTIASPPPLRVLLPPPPLPFSLSPWLALLPQVASHRSGQAGCSPSSPSPRPRRAWPRISAPLFWAVTSARPGTVGCAG
eukprot:3173250-Alexandrium_andersonii.AAC.1